MNVQQYFAELLAFARNLTDQDQRAIGEQLTEEELAIFHLLTRPQPELEEAEAKLIKQTARSLLATLKAEKLVPDWRKLQQTRQAVRLCIEEIYDRELPSLYDAKVDLTFQHIYDSYRHDGRGVYSEVA
jgi:type I restriction enzyme, R subunit